MWKEHSRGASGVAADEEEKSGRGYSNCMGDDSRSHSVVCVVALYNVFKTRFPTDGKRKLKRR